LSCSIYYVTHVRLSIQNVVLIRIKAIVLTVTIVLIVRAVLIVRVVLVIRVVGGRLCKRVVYVTLLLRVIVKTCLILYIIALLPINLIIWVIYYDSFISCSSVILSNHISLFLLSFFNPAY